MRNKHSSLFLLLSPGALLEPPISPSLLGRGQSRQGDAAQGGMWAETEWGRGSEAREPTGRDGHTSFPAPASLSPLTFTNSWEA